MRGIEHWQQVALIVVIGWCGAVSPAFADSCRQIPSGIVVSTSATPSAYRLVRAGRPGPLGRFNELIAGDRVEFLRSDVTIGIAQPEGETRYKSVDGSLCVVPQSSASWPANGLRMLIDRLLRREVQSDRSVVFRGDGKLSLGPYDLVNGSAVIEEGTRPFAVLWRNGLAPFRVVITDGEGRTIADEMGIRSRLLMLSRPLSLAQGAYRVTVSDVTGAQATGAFTAKAATLPLESGEDLVATCIAAAQLAQSDPTRRFESILRVAVFPESLLAQGFIAAIAEEAP